MSVLFGGDYESEEKSSNSSELGRQCQRVEKLEKALNAILKRTNSKGCITKEIHEIAYVGLYG